MRLPGATVLCLPSTTSETVPSNTKKYSSQLAMQMWRRPFARFQLANQHGTCAARQICGNHHFQFPIPNGRMLSAFLPMSDPRLDQRVHRQLLS